METASKLAVAYAMNALWQLPLLVLSTEIAARLLGRAPGRVLHRVWLGCLFLALTVPAMSFLHFPRNTFSSGPTQRKAAAAPQMPGGERSPNLSFSGEQFDGRAQKPQNAAGVPDLISEGALLLILVQSCSRCRDWHGALRRRGLWCIRRRGRPLQEKHSKRGSRASACSKSRGSS